jgi:hypothetical protein
MSCLGVLFAIDNTESAILKSCENDEELVKYVQETIEEKWDEEWLCQTDKSWEAIHRCFTNGQMELLGGKSPLNAVIFGGAMLGSGRDYYVSLKDNALVKRMANELATIDREILKRRYSKIADDYHGKKSEEDFEYTWAWFENVRSFYLKVSQSDKDVIFTVDQ